MAKKNKMDKVNSLKPWTKYNLTHNQWTKFQCNKVNKNQCGKAKKNFRRKQKVEILQRHGTSVKRSLGNYRNWPEMIVNHEKRTQKHKMKRRNHQNLSPKQIQILTTSMQKFMLLNSTGMSWSMYQTRSLRNLSLSRWNYRNQRRKKELRNLMKTTKMKKNLMKLRMRVKKQCKQKLAWRLEQ